VRRWAFFHNSHDVDSQEMLDAVVRLLEKCRANAPELVVYDVFGGDPVPPEIRLTSLPCLVNKQFSLATPGPYYVGEIVLEFLCLDWKDRHMPYEAPLVYVITEWGLYSLTASGGKFTITLRCGEPQVVKFRLEAEEYWPLDVEVKIENVPSVAGSG
jgi:hypothetical protein